MQNLAEIGEILPGVLQEVESNAAKKEAGDNIVKMERVYDAAWIEGQKNNIRSGISKKTNELLQIPERSIGKELGRLRSVGRAQTRSIRRLST